MKYVLGKDSTFPLGQGSDFKKKLICVLENKP